MKWLNLLAGKIFPGNLGNLLSEEGKERTALGVSARYSRGNVKLQGGRVTTDRAFKKEMEAMSARASKHASHSH